MEDTKNIPTAIVPAISRVLRPVDSDSFIWPCIDWSMVLYIPHPGTNGIIEYIIKVVAGVFSTLAITSEYMEANTEAVKKHRRLEEVR